MGNTAIGGLINNAALLVALGLLYDMTLPRQRRGTPWLRVLFGLCIGSIAVAVMLNPWQLRPGLVFDTRSVVLSVAALFFGAVPSVVAAVVAGLYRLSQGGAGTLTGVLVIAMSVGIGLAWRYGRRRWDRPLGWLELYAFGGVVHVGMLLCMLTLKDAVSVLGRVGLPVMVIYPVATVLLSELLLRQQVRWRTEQQVRRLNRVYAVLSNINQAIVRVRDPQALFEEACRIAVRDGGLRTAWIGLVEEATQEVRPVAHAGQNADLMDQKLSVRDEPAGRGPTGTALREGRHVVVADVRRDPGMAPWRQMATERGLRSAASFPLKVGGKVRGALSLYSDEPGFFDEDEVRLLDELAMDLSFAMEFAEQEQARQRVEAELRETTARLQSLIDAAPMAIIQLDLDGIVRLWNRAAEEVFGWTSEEAVGRLLPYVPPHALEEFHGRLKRALASGIQGEDTVRVRKDGTTIDVSVSAAPIRDAQGRIMGVMSLTKDISERKQAEKLLRESEARYRSLFENNHTVMLLMDPDGGRIVDANPAACAYYGWSREQITTMRIDEINTLSAEQVAAEMQQARSQKRNHFLFKHRLADGSVRDVEVLSGPIQMKGKALLYSIVHDISDRVRVEQERDRMEAELRQAQKMEAVGRLAGGVAHDFNNMLTVILGYADSTLRQLEASSPLRTAIQEIRNAGKRSADLTRQLLAFSRRQIVKLAAVNLNEQVASQLKMLGRLIGEDVRLNFVPAHSLWTIRIDPSQVDQILANLAANARDAMADAGTLTIETANVTLDETYSQRDLYVAPGEYVMLAVSDTGAGMDAATLEHIFEPFFTTKGEGRGTGLGLSTVYGIVKQNGGVIHAYSEPGMGTTFKLYFPRFSGAASEGSPDETGGRLDGDEVVLVVEDEEQILKLAKAVLESHGYTVLTATTPTEACDLAEDHAGPIHLLLTDVVMPGMNGKQLQACIERIKPGIKALFMSGYTANVIAHRGVLDEGVDFLQKPFSLEVLAQKVRQILDGRE